ncbi:uncharacterized protein LOC132734979 [Ruditapes philippinarum]|uniref:uncharacterized protein LOC132734979 n=1 Tax=Ruditapes philippinarum TaxID=129788 RepID=UPI00295C2FDD|nr:uncharacterized protein LOC132734979 [Ruditapes philippinarum]
MYITLFCILNSKWKKIAPVEGPVTVNQQVPESSTGKRNGSILNSKTHKCANPTEQTSNSRTLPIANIRNTVSNIGIEITKIQNYTNNLSAESTSHKAQCTEINLQARQSAPRDALQRSKQRVIAMRAQRQIRVFRLVGIILLFLNICSWPSIIVFLLRSHNQITAKRNSLMMVFTTMCFNSALNPVLYAATLTEFRKYIYDGFIKIKNYFKC